jgi:hypothetical protein
MIITYEKTIYLFFCLPIKGQALRYEIDYSLYVIYILGCAMIPTIFCG